jgi:hypothetical protein
VARDYAAERERAAELAQERGFDSFYDQRIHVEQAADWFDDHGHVSDFDERLEFAQMAAYIDDGGGLNDYFADSDYDGNIADWFFETYEWASWADFREWLEEMYGA